MTTFTPAANTIDRKRYASTYTEKSFPTVLGPHSIMLNFSSYSSDKRGTIKANPGTDSIALPIPTNLVDTFQMKVGSYELGVAGKAAQSAASMTQSYFSGNSTALRAKDAVQYAAGIAAKMGLTATTRIVEALGGESVIKGAESGLGAMQNPYVALTFDGIDLKSHQFEWTLAPESAADSENLRSIINHIKMHVTPGYKLGYRAFLAYPSVVDIFFIGSEEGYMYNFKRCMVNSFSANYAGGGAAAFVEGGRPAVVTLSMSLTEMEIWTTDEFGGEGGDAKSINSMSQPTDNPHNR